MTLIDLPPTPAKQPKRRTPANGLANWRALGRGPRKQCDACLQLTHETWPEPPMPVRGARHARTVDGTTQLLCADHAQPLKDLDNLARAKAKEDRKKGATKR